MADVFQVDDLTPIRSPRARKGVLSPASFSRRVLCRLYMTEALENEEGVEVRLYVVKVVVMVIDQY